ncbi:hypothetical protein [Ammoniphilus sp. YIM 78166]|uniref:hypothetical protein n=1 Tax=Ammoniphilus sp. YIM 78166 TaxID=1644106 RepID=UPI00106FF839|nr:hypothetical protein [Ammoniphilus sp. YIM 78166]
MFVEKEAELVLVGLIIGLGAKCTIEALFKEISEIARVGEDRLLTCGQTEETGEHTGINRSARVRARNAGLRYL